MVSRRDLRILRSLARSRNGQTFAGRRHNFKGGIMMMNPRVRCAQRSWLWLASTLLVTAPGCAGEDASHKPQEVVAPNIETFVTDAPGIDKFKGFNEVYDVVQDSCLKRCN